MGSLQPVRQQNKEPEYAMPHRGYNRIAGTLTWLNRSASIRSKPLQSTPSRSNPQPVG